VAGLVLAWGGALAGKLRPDARHTYGWQRASVLAAFINALLLLVAMGSLAWEAVGRLNTPEATQGWTLIAVAGAGIVVNTATALMFMRGREGDLNIRGAFLHMAADALVSLGVVLGGALYLWQGWAWIDPVMSLAIAVVIVVGTWSLFRQSLHLLFDGVPEHLDLLAVQKRLLGLPGVAGVHDLHVWAMGTSQTALTAHLVLSDQAAGSDAVLREAGHELQEHFGISHITLQVESAAYARQCMLRTGTGCS
jgi:cobalt-zinc-cadmium efflux system protein